MSRKIKFRFWDGEDEEFVDLRDVVFRFTPSNKAPLILTFKFSKRFVVEQYTGLKDKNGKEIYEGDIVELFDKKFLIKWSEYAFAYIAKGEGQHFWLDKSKSVCKIIGNIHETPELWKKEQ